jgi:hypothetical protein
MRFLRIFISIRKGGKGKKNTVWKAEELQIIYIPVAVCYYSILELWYVYGWNESKHIASGGSLPGYI